MGDMRDARTAGKNPPTSPMIPANASARTMICGVGSNENTISDQLAKFIIENFT